MRADGCSNRAHFLPAEVGLQNLPPRRTSTVRRGSLFAGSFIATRAALVPAGRVIGTATISWYWMLATDSVVRAQATSAREKGQAEYADRLTEQAVDFLDAAKAAELVAAKQQQQPRPKKE